VSHGSQEDEPRRSSRGHLQAEDAQENRRRRGDRVVGTGSDEPSYTRLRAGFPRVCEPLRRLFFKPGHPVWHRPRPWWHLPVLADDRGGLCVRLRRCLRRMGHVCDFCGLPRRLRLQARGLPGLQQNARRDGLPAAVWRTAPARSSQAGEREANVCLETFWLEAKRSQLGRDGSPLGARLACRAYRTRTGAGAVL
jgi:hypothetical protein